MTLKLVDKDLRSKYAEALYKNEASYYKEIDLRLKRLNIDYLRNSQNIDAGSQIFLNKIRQKRSKWIQDDIRFRDHYRLVCRNVHNKKLENLRQIFEQANEKPHQSKNLDPRLQNKLEILQEQIRLKEMNTTLFFNSEPNIRQKNPEVLNLEQQNNYKASNIPKLPLINRNFDMNEVENELYSRYTKSDRDFLEKFPAKVELTVTDVGKQYIFNEKQRNLTLKRQKQKYSRIQDNALHDSRYKNLVNYLN